MLKMATLSLKTDLHSLFERSNDSFAKMLVNLPGILKDILFELLQSCGFVSVNEDFEMPPKEKVAWIVLLKVRTAKAFSWSVQTMVRKVENHCG